MFKHAFLRKIKIEFSSSTFKWGTLKFIIPQLNVRNFLFLFRNWLTSIIEERASGRISQRILLKNDHSERN